MSANSYKQLSNFGSNAHSAVNNPLTYCVNDTLDQRFLHGSHSDTLGQHSRSCQLFMSEYCANKWDGFCEVASKNVSNRYPNNAERCTFSGGSTNLTAGEILIRNTAARKYLVKMHNATKKYEPFDATVPTSPMISYWVSDNCNYSNAGVPEYAVNPKTIDGDIVMNKILVNPGIAMDILINIYNTMKRYGTLTQLKGTRLGNFYNIFPYFVQRGGLTQ